MSVWGQGGHICNPFQNLVEGVGVPTAGVKDIHPKLDSRQEVRVAVDPDVSIQSFVSSHQMK